jgi:hypothetical protein
MEKVKKDVFEWKENVSKRFVGKRDLNCINFHSIY